MFVRVLNGDVEFAIKLLKRKLRKDPAINPLQLIAKRSERKREKTRRAEARLKQQRSRMARFKRG